MDRLQPDEVEQQLGQLDGWKMDEKMISRRYRFPSFAVAVTFVNQVADIAEQMNHHPFIAIDFKMVTLRLTSWHAGGLTHLDFEEAMACDEAASKLTK